MSSKENIRGAVLKHLESQNRPFSANDITQNLKDIGKSAVLKAIDNLVEDGKVLEKSYGKQKVYCVKQDEGADPINMQIELTELDSKIVDLTEKIKTAEQELKVNEGLLKDLENQPTTEDALKEKEELESCVNKLEEKFETLSKSKVQISDKERDTIRNENEKYMKEFRKRKRICMEIVDSILENYPKTKKAFLEEVGIETDEDAGCNLTKTG